MISYDAQTTTIGSDITSLFDEVEKFGTLSSFEQNIGALPEVGFTAERILRNSGSFFNRRKEYKIPRSSTQDIRAPIELDFEEEDKSGTTQEFTDTQQQLPAFPFYEEKDILNLDAVIDTPPPRLSRTIQVKLTYEEPSEPMPVEDPWE